MLHKFLFNASFHALLNQIDQDLAHQIKKQNCPYCKKPLHSADYPRSPHGVPKEFREQYQQRLSFCCADCRTTSPSVRFFGRRWFVAPVFMLINLLSQGGSLRSVAKVKHYFDISVSTSTWKRWRQWWRYYFERTDYFQQAKGLLAQPVSIFPRGLHRLFQGTFFEKTVLLLQFLTPMTAGVLRAV